MPASFSDYLQTTATVAGVSVTTPYNAVWVRLVSNATATAYVSASATNTNGLFTFNNLPADIYTVYTGPTNVGAWTATGDANYVVSDPASLTGYLSVADFGAKGDGVTDDTAAIQACVAAAVTAGSGVVWFPASLSGTRNYKTSGTITVNSATISLRGAGSAQVKISYTGSGDAIRYQMVPFVVGSAAMGSVSGLNIDGSGAGAGAVGLHYGDALGGELDDLQVSAFDKAGSKGIWMDNRTNWTERVIWKRVTAYRNTIGVLFDVNASGTVSFQHTQILDLRLDINGATQVGIQTQNAAAVEGSFFVTGNNGVSGGITINMLDTSVIGAASGANLFSVYVEGVAGAKGLVMAAGATLSGAGAISLAQGPLTNSNAGTNNIQFGGYLNCPGINTIGGAGSVATGVSLLPGVQPDGTVPAVFSDSSLDLVISSGGTGNAIIHRPGGIGSNHGQVLHFVSGGAVFRTYDGSGAIENVLDDGAGNHTIKGHYLSSASGAPATSTLGANVTSVTFTGNDRRGTIAIVMAGALAANTKIATCTYATSYGATAPFVFLINQTSGVGLANVAFYRLAVSTGVSFDLACDQALATGTYTVGYIVEG